jgi:hypothetical protein
LIPLLADIDPPTIWNGPNGSTALLLKIGLALVVSFGVLAGLLAAPIQLRRPVVALVTFVSGLYYVLLWAYPAPIKRGPFDLPRTTPESISFWLDSAQGVVVNMSNIISGFLIGLGVYSLLRIHLKKIARQQTDWVFSLVLVVCLFGVAFIGFTDWSIRQDFTHWTISQTTKGSSLGNIPNEHWGPFQYAKDLLFDGFLQKMDAAMFSMIAFYILSAAYRAFRARSVEATVLLLSALVVILSLMGLVQSWWDGHINDTHIEFLKNFRLVDVSTWLRNTMQTSSIRGLDFGVGLGLLAMALRLWLSLENIGSESSS